MTEAQPQEYKAPVQRKTSSFAVASLILGLCAFTVCWIPVIGSFTIPLSALGFIMGVVGFFVTIFKKHGIGYAISGILVSGMALAIAGFMTTAIYTGYKDIESKYERGNNALQHEFNSRSSTQNPNQPVTVERIVADIVTLAIGDKKQKENYAE